MSSVIACLIYDVAIKKANHNKCAFSVISSPTEAKELENKYGSMAIKTTRIV